MKKKMVVLGALLLAVVLTGHSVSGTYAKYTSSFDLADDARVAKWGFQLNGQDPQETAFDLELFKTSYPASGDATKTDVLSTTEVVAPGTSGEYTFTLTGETETNYTIAIDTTGSTNTIVDGTYNPIFFRVDNGNWVNLDQLGTELNNLYKDKVFAAGTHSETPGNHKIEWMWAFELDNDGTDTTLPTFTSDNALDTKLATKATLDSIHLQIKITATQSELAANA